MTDPLVPNFNPPVGRLVTDRYDFQKHLDGSGFRHKADQIDLVTPVVINSQTKTNVDAAIQALVGIINPIVPDATNSVKGLIKLNGDLGGSANSVSVIALRGNPINTLPPNNNDVLTWDSSLSSWGPKANSSAFVAAGDLRGNGTSQTVVGLTGINNRINVRLNVFEFTTAYVPLLTQDTQSSLVLSSDFTIRAQSTTASTMSGGNVILAGGVPGSGGLKGGVKLQFTSNIPVPYPADVSSIVSSNMVQITEVATNRRVLSLCNSNDLNTTDMPANTGDMVAYIRNAVTVPTTGNPTNGAIIYGDGGKVWIKQQDGDQFPISNNLIASSQYIVVDEDSDEIFSYLAATLQFTLAASHVVVLAGINADRTYSIDALGNIPSGAQVWFSNFSNFKLTIQRAGSTNIMVIAPHSIGMVAWSPDNARWQAGFATTITPVLSSQSITILSDGDKDFSYILGSQDFDLKATQISFFTGPLSAESSYGFHTDGTIPDGAVIEITNSSSFNLIVNMVSNSVAQIGMAPPNTWISIFWNGNVWAAFASGPLEFEDSGPKSADFSDVDLLNNFDIGYTKTSPGHNVVLRSRYCIVNLSGVNVIATLKASGATDGCIVEIINDQIESNTTLSGAFDGIGNPYPDMTFGGRATSLPVNAFGRAKLIYSSVFGAWILIEWSPSFAEAP